MQLLLPGRLQTRQCLEPVVGHLETGRLAGWPATADKLGPVDDVGLLRVRSSWQENDGQFTSG